ncbi:MULTISPECIES: DUF3110 domain-containing protein [unclassified Prochlorococcus]|uniref:DUF3110 domain-containing protein n=1 Tax=unclassified Prochlorococcus TaxID=2627481 RepID=UPI00053378FE|nr:MULTISPECIES: DUF3110 domain-containing protein [unclassified Prochlorococcus]KGG15263.1 hypothetical protein EV06_1134 [Prochlorococcus sp. MIT 0602]KGG17540.1 hypothetical protein EV07_0980 [Prochlorococcus sp. MIT 0603]
MLVHVLLYNVGKEHEGIHSIDIKGKTIVLMFEDIDDAERYRGLLEAQDFPNPSIELIEQKEIDIFCDDAGYESRLIQKGFVPITEEDRLFISPPQKNLGLEPPSSNPTQTDLSQNNLIQEDLDTIKENLEKLI